MQHICQKLKPAPCADTENCSELQSEARKLASDMIGFGRGCISVSCIDPQIGGAESEHNDVQARKAHDPRYDDWAMALEETERVWKEPGGQSTSREVDEELETEPAGSEASASPSGKVLNRPPRAILAEARSEPVQESPATKAMLKTMQIQAPVQELGLEDLEDGTETYQGQFQEDNPSVRDGHGTLKVKKGKKQYVYDGEFLENKRHGKAVMRWGDGREYRGQFHQNDIHGEGIMRWPDGRRYVGQYENNQKHGTGIFFFKEDGRQHEGNWRNGKRHGRGVYTNTNDQTIQGVWHDDEPIESTLESVPNMTRDDQGFLMHDASLVGKH